MIRDVVSFVRTHTVDGPPGEPRPTKPWLVLGKGPSLERWPKCGLGSHNVFALNHAWRVHPSAEIVHFCDIEAFEEEADVLCGSCPATLVCLPWHPHEKMKPSAKTLLEHCSISGTGRHTLRTRSLQWLIGTDRLLAYNSTTGAAFKRHPNLDTVRVKYFSAEAAFGILARANVREIFSLGVDGGKGYAPGFAEHNRLANGRDSFDIQMPEIEKTCKKFGVTWTRL